jgi:hypothetical protein
MLGLLKAIPRIARISFEAQAIDHANGRAHQGHLILSISAETDKAASEGGDVEVVRDKGGKATDGRERPASGYAMVCIFDVPKPN